MRFVQMVVLIVFSFSLWAGEGKTIQFEPVYEYQVESIFKINGKEVKNKRDTFFSGAELQFSSIPFHRQVPPQGYVETRKKVTTAKGEVEKLTWIRDGKGNANHHFFRGSFLQSKTNQSPPFMIPLNGGVDFPVPGGIMEFEVEPFSEANTKDKDEIALSYSIKGKYQKPVIVKIGSKSIKAHLFQITILKRGKKSELELVVCKEVEYGLVSLKVKLPVPKNGVGVMQLCGMKILNVPPKMMTFSRAGFGFAPPDKFDEVKALDSELIRYKSQDGRVISIKSFDPSGLSIDKWWRKRSHELAKKNYLVYGTSLKGVHLAGAITASYVDLVNDIQYVHAIHNGKGVAVTMKGFKETNPEELRKLMYGWRWIKK